jgi:hypothetical protein
MYVHFKLISFKGVTGMNTQKLVDRFSNAGFVLHIDYNHDFCIAVATAPNFQYVIGEGRKSVVKEKCDKFLKKQQLH